MLVIMNIIEKKGISQLRLAKMRVDGKLIGSRPNAGWTRCQTSVVLRTNGTTFLQIHEQDVHHEQASL